MTPKEKQIRERALNFFRAHPDALLYPPSEGERERLGFHFRNRFRWGQLQWPAIEITPKRWPN